MRAVVQHDFGGPEVLELVERPVPEPGRGEVRIRIVYSGVNPADWKRRSSAAAGGAGAENACGQDGSGVVDAVGPGVDRVAVGDRVWVYLVTHLRPGSGTAQEYMVLPAEWVMKLPAGASFELGAALGVPALTAHRALTVHESGPRRLAPGALAGRTVLVTGGAGAVGHAAIQLARWAGATVLTTISSPEKAALAQAAGAHHIVNYRTADVTAEVRKFAPEGVDLVVEVAPASNTAINQNVLANHGCVSIFASEGGTRMAVEIGPHFWNNVRLQFLILYTLGQELLDTAAEDVGRAVADGALPVGAEAGLPLTFYPLDQTAEAHSAVENGAVGKVLISVTPA